MAGTEEDALEGGLHLQPEMKWKTATFIQSITWHKGRTNFWSEFSLHTSLQGSTTHRYL
jgi:hypothetical protein